MDVSAILMLLIALVALPAAVVLVEFRVRSHALRAAVITGALVAAVGLIWAVRSTEVRGTSYLHRSQFGMTLYAIQESLDHGFASELRNALATNAGAGWFQTPAMVQISSLRESLEAMNVQTNRNVGKQ
jgi:hypothetical protein